MKATQQAREERAAIADLRPRPARRLSREAIERIVDTILASDPRGLCLDGWRERLRDPEAAMDLEDDDA